MYFTNKIFFHGVFLALVLLTLVAGAQAAAQDMPMLVAKPYPGAVPENTKDGKHIHCNASVTAYCFLTRDTPDKVRAFYAKEGVKLAPLANEERVAIGRWLSNFEHALRVDLESKPSVLFVAPLEFYQTKGADDEPSYFNGVIVMAGTNRASLQGDGKGQQAMIDDEVMGHFALSPISKIMIPLYGNIYMEPARLIPHYNRHLGMLSGYFREVDGSSAAKSKYLEMHPTWALPVGASGGSEMDTKQDAMREELREILSRKPEKKNQYQSLRRSAHNKEAREKIQPELDKILMSDPELAAWKKRSDALEQQEKAGGASAQSDRTLRDEDVEAYLQALEKEVYYTRILIHISGGRRVSRDPATLRREWSF